MDHFCHLIDVAPVWLRTRHGHEIRGIQILYETELLGKVHLFCTLWNETSGTAHSVCFLLLFFPSSLFWFVLSLFHILPLFNCDLDVCYSGASHPGLRCRQCSWLVDWPLMKFRQRIAWLAVILYLTASFGFVYYIFEINDHFNSFALDHVRTYHNGNRAFVVLSLWYHATDIPLAIWLIIFLLPYLQIFGMLLAWTRVEPWRSTAFQWPGIVFNKWRKLYKRLTGHPHHGSKAINSTVAFNGHVVIDTWWRVLLSSVSKMWVW